MSTYRLDYDKRVRGQLRAMPAGLQKDAAQVIQDLRSDPYPPESEPLRREISDLRRIRINGWRIIYKVFDDDRVVRIISVRPRDRDTYTAIF